MIVEANSFVASGKRRIMLVDDHAVVRQGFAELINSEPGLEVCGQFNSVAKAFDAVKQLKPDLVLTDLSLEGRSGMELIVDLKASYPRIPVLVFSMHDENLYAERVLQAGARGYVMKREDCRTLMKAILTVLAGNIYLSDAASTKLLQNFVGGSRKPMTQAPVSRLTNREIDVFRLIGEGCTVKQIAHQLHLSVSTIETHRAHIKEKLNVDENNKLMRLAIAQNGF
jgi:DNA-binding NarL/FixJ family response regulator